MKITLCGSIAFYSEMLSTKENLEKIGHKVELPPKEVKDKEGNPISVEDYYQIRKNSKEDDRWVWDRKKEAMLEHFDKIKWADAILVLNYDKKNIRGYIGSNTLIEMGLALFLNKKIYLLNSVPDLPYKEEILGVRPVIIHGNLNKIR